METFSGNWHLCHPLPAYLLVPLVNNTARVNRTYTTEMMIRLSRRWSMPKIVAAAAALALMSMLASVPGVDAMFSSSSDVVQARDREIHIFCHERVERQSKLKQTEQMPGERVGRLVEWDPKAESGYHTTCILRSKCSARLCSMRRFRRNEPHWVALCRNRCLSRFRIYPRAVSTA